MLKAGGLEAGYGGWRRGRPQPITFFAHLKAKHARETIKSIRLEDGRETSNETEIQTTVMAYFRDKFRCPDARAADVQLRKEVRKFVDRTFSGEQNQLLIVRPIEQEVDQLVEELPKDKTPGLDGITNNMIQDCWSFIRNDCQEMMQSFWVIGELMQKDSQGEACFLKLDFAKAYDRVRHDFIWDTLTAMKFDWKFISLLKGLVLNDQSKVHVNGWFTDVVPLERGVRQGCPMAPYLFVLSTQPLMLLFEKAQKDGRIEGIHLPGGRQLLHQLFANDTGVHLQAREQDFRAAKIIVETFERISGALLNLGKSLIIPLGGQNPPAWMSNTGCQIAEEGKLEGKPKASLVNWEVAQKPKKEEGLGFGSFKTQADVMKLKQVTRVMNHEETGWADILAALLSQQARGWNPPNQGEFLLQEFLILGPQLPPKATRTVKWLLSGWYRVRKFLRLNHLGATLPHNLEMWQVEKLMRYTTSPPQVDWKKLRAAFRNCEVERLSDLVDTPRRRRILPGIGRLMATDAALRDNLNQLELWLRDTKVEEYKLVDSTG
ncbi:hypothetical protein R1sor_018475 [Riccia sorocarpa]|uniref:Reverse transcriptase domain-containing protein n=1 Tax=Riccia sorocarpa TaxID=122646 RepID=A0ABD3I9T5_9MARC